MEVAMELEDDLFFADLSKEISLLIMEEDEEPLTCCPKDSFQAFSGAIYHPPQFGFLYGQALRRESKGTGVFIPQLATQPRRNNKQRKGRSNSHSKYQKQSQDTRMVNSQAPHHKKNSLKPRNGTA